jgi:hypothetical protein
VEQKLAKITGVHSRATLIYANIGLVEGYGIPIFKRPTTKRLLKWANYVDAPWQELRKHRAEPDTILVDGRFRVACVLQSLLNLSSPSGCLILLDDYHDRPHYRAIEQFADISSVNGRMTVFSKKYLFESESCRRALVEYHKDWR